MPPLVQGFFEVELWLGRDLRIGSSLTGSDSLLVSGLLLGVVLAGFGARALLRHASWASARRDPGSMLVDGWLAVLWLLGALLAAEPSFGIEGLAHEFNWPIDGQVLFATAVLLVLPAVLLAIVREIWWSVATSNRAAAAASGALTADRGSPVDAGPDGHSPVAAGDSWRLWPALRGSARASIGLVLTGALAVGSCAVALLAWSGHPALDRPVTDPLYASLYATEVVAVTLVAVAVATVVGTLLASGLDSLPRNRWIEALAIDPLTNVLQLPLFLLLSWVATAVLETPSITDVWFAPVTVGVLGGLVVLPLVSRVARVDRERGRRPRRVAVRAAGIALCGAAVLSVWMGWFIFQQRIFPSPLLTEWGPFASFSAFLLVHTAGLFLLGDGLRAVASDAAS